MSVPIRMDVFRTYKSRAAMGRGGPALNYALCDGPMGALLRNSARVATPIWKVEPLPKVAAHSMRGLQVMDAPQLGGPIGTATTNRGGGSRAGESGLVVLPP